MKFLILLLSLTFVEKGCTGSEINQDHITIEYTASSRGTYKQIIINNKTVSKTDKRGKKPIQTNCSEIMWNKIMETLKTIDFENIPNLEAPSKKFQFDGAPLANLKLFYGDTVYVSKPFDHGNPHKDIELLIKDILSMTKNIE